MMSNEKLTKKWHRGAKSSNFPFEYFCEVEVKFEKRQSEALMG